MGAHPAGAQRGDQHRAQQEHADQHSHRPVAPGAAASRGDDHRRDRPADQDPHREGHDPPAHDPRPFVGVLGHLRRQGDVGHLEQRVAGGRHEERDRDVGGRGGPGTHPGEHEREGHRQRDGAEEHQPGAGPATDRLPVAGGADVGVEHDVPGLRQHHDETGHGRRHAEHVGQVVEQQQPGNGREDAGAHRPQGVAEQGAPPERSGGQRARRGRARRACRRRRTSCRGHRTSHPSSA